MNEAAVTGRLIRAGLEHFVTPRRVEMLRALSSNYEEQGLLSARSAPPLHDCCPDATACWSSLPPAARPSKGDSCGFVRDRPGSMIWPWVGERYEAGGVALLGLNFRSGDTEATVALEYLAATNDAEQFADGDYKSRFNSDFPYRSMATAAAVLASVNGQRPIERPAAESLAETMEHVARLQLVKCTPVDTVVRRGAPSGVMRKRCPERFLMQELDLLRPGVLVAFGLPAYRALNPRPDVKWLQYTYLCRGSLRRDTHTVMLIWLPHPSHPDWLRGQRSLVRSLRRKSLYGPDGPASTKT